jgi:hypothetical protein
MDSTKIQLANVAIRAWTNLIKHSYNPEAPRDTMQFEAIVIPLLYMAQEQHSIPVMSHATPGAPDTDVPRVVVLPRLAITTILPPDIAVADYAIPVYCANSVKIMSSVQSSIKAKFAQLVAAGKAYDIQIRV